MPTDPPNERAEALRKALIRNFRTAEREHFVREPLYESMCTRLAQGTVAKRLGVGIDTVPPGKRSCPYHSHHAEEEVFVILEGRGTLRVAGEMLAIEAGDVIFIPPGPEYPHHILNTSDAPLQYLSIGTNESPEVCEYPDSGKYGVYSELPGGRRLRALHREGDQLDYWDGEA